MIKLLFGFGSDKILIRIDGAKVYFSNTSFGAVESEIDGLNISKEGAIKESPDLEGDAEWRKKTIERFKEKISNFKTEQERADYIIEDLKKFGYIPEQIQKEGFRPTKIN
jgi:hypothetical protein